MERLSRVIAFFTCLTLAACASVAVPSVRTGAFGVAHTYTVNESVTFPDTLVVTLERIDDSRCKPNVQCVWAGELAPTFRLVGGAFGTDARDVTLGTTRNATATAGPYTLTLGTVTVGTGSPDTAVLTVTRSEVATTGSGVRGTAHVGPTCPVVRNPPDPACADRPYAGTFVITTVGGLPVADTASGADGTFAQSLPAGSYRVGLRDSNRLPSLAPQDFTVRVGEWTTLDLALDSGIR